MSKKTAKQIEAQIKAIEKNATDFIGKLEKELEFAKTQRMTEKHQQDLERQIKRARAAYYDGPRGLNKMHEELQQVLAAEEAELLETEAAIERNATATKRQIKKQLLDRWIKSGGSLELFDKVFEEKLYPDEMARRVQERGVNQNAEDEEGKRRIRKVAGDAFSR